jgi:hypothetical protein
MFYILLKFTISNFINITERIKERIKVNIHGEAFDFDNIDNWLSFLLKITFSSVRPRSRFQVVVSQLGYSFINQFL